MKLVDERPVHVTADEPPTEIVFGAAGKPAVFPISIVVAPGSVTATASDAAKHDGWIVKVADDDELRVTDFAQ